MAHHSFRNPVGAVVGRDTIQVPHVYHLLTQGLRLRSRAGQLFKGNCSSAPRADAAGSLAYIFYQGEWMHSDAKTNKHARGLW